MIKGTYTNKLTKEYKNVTGDAIDELSKAIEQWKALADSIIDNCT